MESRKNEILYILREYFLNYEVDDETDLFDYQVLDSLSVIELASYIEEKFSMDVFIEDMTRENFGSINSIVQYIVSRL